MNSLYRPCVGVALFNQDGLVFLGRRRDVPEDAGEGRVWQMPQGGIDPGETPYEAALRELEEEAGVHSVSLLGESAGWLRYDLPGELAGEAWGGRWRGQQQKWLALRFQGEDSEIDIERPGGHAPEFAAWRWERLERAPELVVPFKRRVYEQVAAEFRRFAAP
jgi:putative (di)nucleoside polyphosphate hydrolase